MSRSRLALAIGIAVLHQAAAKIDLSRVAPPPADKPIPIADFFRPRILTQPTMNPAGTHVAAIITADEDKQYLLVHDLKTLKNEITGSSDDVDMRSVFWAGDSRVIFSMARRKIYSVGLFGADLRDIRDYYPIIQHSGASLLAVPPSDRTNLLMWVRGNVDSRRDRGAAVISTKNLGGRLVGPDQSLSGWIKVAQENNEKHIVQSYPVAEHGATYRYLADREGRPAFAFNHLDGVRTMFRLDEREWVECPVDLEEFRVIEAGDRPGELVVLAPKADGKPRALRLMDAATGELGDVLLQDTAYDFDGWLFRTRAKNEIVGAMFNRDGPRTVWFTEEYQALQKILGGFFPGMVVRIIDSNDAETRFLVSVFSDRQPVVYNIVDLEKRSVGLFKNTAPWIDPARMQPMNIIKFKTRDGRKLDAYLTLPAGASKENPAPMVVIPCRMNGERDTWGFDAESQFLASRGYAVLKTNHRSSSGYGWMFTDEEEWDFVEAHEDVTAATKALVASGYVDPDRIAIMGRSLGGYFALMGVTEEPGLYRCAVAIGGLFDWKRHVLEQKEERFDDPLYGRLVKFLGDPRKEEERFRAMSPIHRVERIRVPVFVAGDKQDRGILIEQSKALLAALQKHDVPHEDFIVRAEGYGMAHIEDEVKLYGRIEAFLARHMAPRKAP